MERKVDFRLLQVIAIYALINMITVLAFLHFKFNLYPYVALSWLILLVGWLYFCILQYRVHYYENLKVQQITLRSVYRRGRGTSTKLASTDAGINRFKKSFPLTMKIIKLLEGKNEQ